MGQRSFFMLVFTGIALATFLLRFSGSFWASCGFFLAGSLGAAARLWFLWREERRTVRAEGLDFQKLKSLRLPQMGEWLKQNVRGHADVIDDMTRVLRNNIQLARPGRMLGSFLLVGPTGTGKSFLAQLVSESMFPGVQPVVLRMNQFKSPDDVFTLLGAPPGRAGFELGGALTKPVGESPFRVVILDELEKAHFDIFDCLYDILDTASCREKSSGRMIDFSGCVFFATSNAAVDLLRRAKGDGKKDAATLEASYREALTQGSPFNRAFIARWERVYFLDTLAELHVAEVALLNLTKYWQQFGMTVTYASPALILQTVLKNREFREFGVRQLMSFIRQKSDPVVNAARSMGQKEVMLDVTPAGDFILGAPLRKGQGHGSFKKGA